MMKKMRPIADPMQEKEGRGLRDMEDQKIIDLYFQREEIAISETKSKYSRLLLSISYGILKIMADAEECENDTYWKTWNAIPPKQPENLPAFLSKIVRNLSLDRYDSLHAEKRGRGEIPLIWKSYRKFFQIRGRFLERAMSCRSSLTLFWLL